MTPDNIAPKNLSERLSTIRKAIGDTVVVRVGLTPRGDIDIIDVKNSFNKDKQRDMQEEKEEKEAEDNTLQTYIC